MRVETVTIQIDRSTYALLKYGAEAAGISEDEFLRLALMTYQPMPPRDLPDDPWTPLTVHATYLKKRTDGQFVRATTRLTVTTGPLAGTTYGSPSAAAAAVIRAINPARTSGHNDGWRFWRVSGSGEPLDVVRTRRRAPRGDGGDG